MSKPLGKSHLGIRATDSYNRYFENNYLNIFSKPYTKFHTTANTVIKYKKSPEYCH